MGRRGERARREGQAKRQANALGGREGLVHRFAAAWVRVRAALGDG